jgi:hypothetical protein
MADVPPLLEISYDKYDGDDESNDSLDLGGAEGKSPVSLKQTEFSLKEFAKRIGHANYTAFNKWKKGWVAGFIEKKHRSIIRGQTWLKQLRDGSLHSATAVEDFLETFESWLPLDNFNYAEWIVLQGVEMFLKKCPSEICEVRKKGRRGNMRPVTDLGDRASRKVRSNLPELLNTTFTIVICRVSDGKHILESPKSVSNRSG